ncbi:MAG: S8 family serine peptidase, partial [Candidatus Lokiarchaeota archaeon]|nr:S8 family serine peptidase [Candidatus Lokiarchaeota archaeon]
LAFDAQDYIGLSPNLWNGNLTGKGVTVAVLDTGIQPNHDTFTYDGTQSWNERIKVFYDESIENSSSNPYDIQWHGTWATSILGGNSSSYIGVAPGVDFVIMKLFYDDGSEIITSSQILEKAVDWLIENKEIYDIKIVSMSFGVKPTSDNTNGLDQLNRIVTQLVDENILVVAAAGNDNDASNEPTINSPASAKSVLAVGGVDYYGEMYTKSSRGPTYEGVIKPDVCAPAVSVYGAYPSFSSNSYTYATGTSASTPFVAGLAALMIEKDPTLTALQLKNIISITSYRTIYPQTKSDNIQGWGISQGYAALGALDSPIIMTDNIQFNVNLNENFSVFCQPIILHPNHYFFELSQLGDISAEMYLFDSNPDGYGSPVLISHSINGLSILDPTKRMGAFVSDTHEYFLVVKSLEQKSGDFTLQLVIEYRNGILIVLAILNIVGIVYVLKIKKHALRRSYN